MNVSENCINKLPKDLNFVSQESEDLYKNWVILKDGVIVKIALTNF